MGNKIDSVTRNTIEIEKMNKVSIGLLRDMKIQKFIN